MAKKEEAKAKAPAPIAAPKNVRSVAVARYQEREKLGFKFVDPEEEAQVRAGTFSKDAVLMYKK